MGVVDGQQDGEPTPIEVVAGKQTVIIGAGAAGLAVGACLRRKGRECVLLEQGERVGGAWHGRYERLHLHTTKYFSHLPFVPFPKEYPMYPSRLQVAEYLTSYAARFELRPLFGQQVRSARFRHGYWHVRTDTTVYQAQNLVVATGYNRKPRMPDFPGLERYTGEMLHSRDFSNGARFAGKRVLVVGFGNSGGEIAIDLWESGAQTSIAIRSPVHVLPRDLHGIPAQISGMLLARLPPRLAEAISLWVARVAVRDLEALGIRRPTISPIQQVRERGRIPLVDIGTIELIRQGAVKVTPGVRELTEDGVIFADGSAAAFDALVFATGFVPALDEFLEGAERLTDERGYPKGHGGAPPLPGLYFIGYRNPITGALNDIAREAMAISEHIAA